MKLQKLSSDKLKSRLEKLVRHERKVMAVVIEHIAEVERRRSYHDWNFSSLYDYLVHGLGYSESAAYRRMQAARALIQVPEIKERLEKGSLNLSQISMAQTFIRQEQKQNGAVPVEEKKEIFSSLQGKTAVESQKILDQMFPSVSVSQADEKHRADDSLELNIRLPREVRDKLTRIKELYSHLIPDGDWCRVIDQMATDVLAKRDPLTKKVRTKTAQKITKETQGNTDAEVKSQESADVGQAVLKSRRTIRESVRRFIFQRDRVCQYRHPNGSSCGSRFQLEIDHVQPQFAGGRDDAENLRVLCRAHNRERYMRGR